MKIAQKNKPGLAFSVLGCQTSESGDPGQDCRHRGGQGGHVPVQRGGIQGRQGHAPQDQCPGYLKIRVIVEFKIVSRMPKNGIRLFCRLRGPFRDDGIHLANKLSIDFVPVNYAQNPACILLRFDKTMLNPVKRLSFFIIYASIIP